MPKIDMGPKPGPAGLGPFVLAFSEISDGNMERVLAERVAINANRERFFSKIGIEWNSTIRVRPSHSANVDALSYECGQPVYKRFLREPTVSADFDFFREGADGIITTANGQSIALITADCVPIAVWNPDGSVHGLIHAGLLPTLNGIVFSLADALTSVGQRTSRLRVYLGPSISEANYDLSRSGLWEVVGPEVLASGVLAPLLQQFMSGTRIDLRAVIVNQLLQVGFVDKNIELFQPCTAASDSNYFSNYAAKHLGGKRGGFCTVLSAAVQV